MADRRLKNILEYIGFRFLAGIFRLLPRVPALRLGEQLGRLMPYIQPKRQRIATENLRHAYPQLSETERSAMCAKMFRHLGISAAELVRLDTLREADIDQLFMFEGLENLRAAQAMDRGFIILTAHLGFWEVGTFFLPLLGFPCDFIGKKAKNPYFDAYLKKMREQTGSRVIYAQNAARQIVASLGEKRGVGVLIDHHMTPHKSVAVPFFGRMAWTTPIITQIAMKRSIPVVPAFSYRTDDLRYRIVLEEPIVLDSEITDDTVRGNTALLSDKIEAAIRQEPSQWFWVHRRWRES